jgi:hypothetical protein
MSEFDAFEEDMDQDLENFLAAVKASVPEQPDPQLESSLVSQLAETARASQRAADVGKLAEARPVVRRPRSRRVALPVRIAFATSLLLASMAGLAVAGVKLPGPVQSGFDKVGISLPNQADDSPQAKPVGAPAHPPSRNGGTGTEESSGQHKGHAQYAKPARPSNNGQSGVSHGQGKSQGKKGSPPGKTTQDPESHPPSKGSKSQGKSDAHGPPAAPGKGNSKNTRSRVQPDGAP